MTTPSKPALFIDIEHPQESLSGRVTFHLPTQYEEIRIEVRKAQLAEPMLWESLPSNGRSLTTVLATLEHLIDTAPAGFYTRDPKGQPLLSPGLLASVDDNLPYLIYAAIQEALSQERFLRTSPAGAPAAETQHGADVPGGETGGA